MAPPSPATATTSQRDFSAGQVDSTVRRDESNPIMKSGARQAVNWRILESKGLANRFGRSALFQFSGRADYVTMKPGAVFLLCFGNGTLDVYTESGIPAMSTIVGMPWVLETVRDAVWAGPFGLSIYITFHGQHPLVLTWDGVSTWSAASYALTVTAGNQKRTAFYRLSPLGVTMQPSTRNVGPGATLTFSAGMNLTASLVGTRMRFVDRQVLITAVTDATHATATIEETLPASQVLGFSVDPSPTFSLGDEVIGTVTGSRGIVTQINAGLKQITVQLLSLITELSTVPTRTPTAVYAFTTSDTCVGPGGSLPILGVTSVGNPEPVTIWDDEVMNDFRGWPSSVFIDQNRLGFCNFPALPQAVAWSAVGLPNDFYPASNPSNAIFELMTEKTQVFHVVPGPEGSEFVFTDKGIRYIPISETNPLKPGSVAFRMVSSDVITTVQPRVIQDLIIFITGNQVGAIVPVGATNRPYTTRILTELRGHLINSPVAIAAPTQAHPEFPERYIYVLNGDGTIAQGRAQTVDGQVNVQGTVGWVPWTVLGMMTWVSALGSRVAFVTRYNTVSLVETLSTSRLDASQLYNSQPPGLPIPPGKGPLWYFANESVDLIDQTNRMMGTYQVDPNGFLIPQFHGGEDFSSPSLMTGRSWVAVLEPFIPAVQAGQDASQRLWPRKINWVRTYVQDSTGFVMLRLYSGQSGPLLPAQGTIMKARRVTTWNQGEDATQPPPLREQSYLDRPMGRAHDPRWAISKDTPGPLTVVELSMGVTV